MNSCAPRAPRRFPFGRLALAAGLLALLALRTLDLGDQGMSNVFSGLLGVLLALGLLVAFARERRLAWRLRRGVLLLVALALAGFFTLVRVVGVSGAMIPELAWRFGARATTSTTPSARRLELAPPSAADFPGFLGPRRDNAVPAARLARDWQVQAPRVRWRQPIGAGWSAFALAGGCGFTLEQDERAQRVSARSLVDGAVAWSTTLDEPFAHALGGDGPRSTPTVAAGRVFGLSAWGVLVCLDASDGALLWRHDLGAEYGLTHARLAELAQYGCSSSPLVAGELVIVPAGGAPEGKHPGLVAFDAASGALRWEGPARNFSYSSPTLAELGGVAQVLVVNEDTLSGHALEDGRLLWEHPWPGVTSANASVSQPVPVPPAQVFVSKGYGGGAALLELVARAGGGFDARERWHDGRLLRTKLTNVVLHEGFVYGLDDGMLECVELASGAKRWKEGRYGHGQLLLAGELLLLCSEEGELLLLEPSAERANAVLGRFQALEGKCWAHLALSANLLVLRNASECVALELP